MSMGNSHKSVTSLTISRRTLLIGLILAVAVITWALLRDGSIAGTTSSPTSPTDSNNPKAIPVAAKIVTAKELKEQTSTLGIPVYWNGEMKGTRIELTILRDASVFVRYLPESVEAGDPNPYFTVATYMNDKAYEQVQALASSAGAKSVKYAGGALTATASETDPNTYFAYEGVPVLINVFSENPPEGWDLIATGSIKLVN